MALDKLAQDKAVAIVEKNADIADDGVLRKDFLRRSGLENFLAKEVGLSPDGAIPILISANRSRHLRPFAQFFSAMLNEKGMVEEGLSESLGNILEALGEGKTPSSLRGKREVRAADDIFANVEDATDLAMLEILRNPNSSRKWLRELDAHVSKSSKEKLREIDTAERRGEYITVPLLIVGGGPLTSLALSALGPYYENMVITDQSELAQSWRNRPIYINSSSESQYPDKPSLPLLQANTTPITVRGHANTVKTGDLLGPDALEIVCDTKLSTGRRKRKTKKFISGPKLGAAVATNIAYNADNYLVNQQVKVGGIDGPRFFSDGSKLVTIEDKRSGKQRQVKAKTVLFLTGPGRETLPIEDGATVRLYTEAEQKVDALVGRAKRQYEKGKRVRIRLPRVLTLTSIEKLYRMWDLDLDRDPELFPLKEIMRPGVDVALVGGGDTTRTLAELLGLNGPPESYPSDLSTDDRPNKVLYNVPYKTPADYNANNRSRYQQVFDDRTETTEKKIEYLDPISNNRGVLITDVDGEEREFDYVFLSLGFERDSLEEQLDSFRVTIGDVRDAQNFTVGMGDTQNGIYIGGSATGFTLKDFPKPIQNIIEGLGVAENTVSLWVFGVLLSRLMWTIGARQKISKDKVSSLLDEALLAVPNPVLDNTRASLT